MVPGTAVSSCSPETTVTGVGVRDPSEIVSDPVTTIALGALYSWPV
jgi:hypothetical protein